MEREPRSNVSMEEKKGAGWQPVGRKIESVLDAHLTLEDLMDESVLEGLTADALKDMERKKKATKKLAAEGELVPLPRPEAPPSLKVIGAKMQEVDIKATMSKMKPYGVQPMASVQRDARDPHFRKGGGLANLFSYAPTFTTLVKDADMFMSLGQLPTDKFDADHINRVRNSLCEANKWLMTNAPQRGLLQRVCDGLARPKPPFKPQDYLQYVCDQFPIMRSKLRDLRGQGISDLKWLKIDHKTSSGVPFMRAKVGANHNDIPEILSISAEIVRAVSEGKIKEWVEKNPSLQVVLLRNKLDKYLLEEVHKKIRPYYTFPAHWNMLFQAIWQPIAEASIMFLDDPEEKSINAHGFSWNRGGAHRLYEWIKSRPPGFHCAAYSDDMIWVFVTTDHIIYVLLPDFKMMDMSLSARFGELTFMWLSTFMTDYWDKTWKSIGELGCRQAFVKFVCVCMSLMYRFENGLGSGIAGTPEYDQVATCAFVGRAKDKFFNKPFDTYEQIKDAVAAAVESGRKSLGLEIKQETLEIHQFQPDQDYEWLVFLGHALRRYEANGEVFYVPIRPYDKIVQSLVSPKGSYGQAGIARVRAMMMRAVGIMASGGWYYAELYFAAARVYNVYAVRGLTPAPENDLTFSEYVEKETGIKMKPFNQNKFPTREWFASLVCPHDIVVEAIDRTVAGANAGVPERPVGTVADMFELGGTWDTGSWADAEDAPMAAVVLKDRSANKDVGGTNVPRPKGTDEKHLGRVQPLSEEQKREYNDARRAARAARRAMYANGVGVTHEKDNKLSKYMALYDEVAVQEFEQLDLDVLDEQDQYTPFTDAELDMLHEQRITPSMIRGYYKRDD